MEYSAFNLSVMRIDQAAAILRQDVHSIIARTEMQPRVPPTRKP